MTTKIHVATNAKGLPLVIKATPGQYADVSMASVLIEALPENCHVVADKGYDADTVILHITERGGTAYIPSRRHRKNQSSVPRHIYRLRNAVERFFNRIKHYRRIATRYDKLVRNYLAAITIASIRLWLREVSGCL